MKDYHMKYSHKSPMEGFLKSFMIYTTVGQKKLWLGNCGFGHIYWRNP